VLHWQSQTHLSTLQGHTCDKVASSKVKPQLAVKQSNFERNIYQPHCAQEMLLAFGCAECWGNLLLPVGSGDHVVELE